MDTMMTYEKTSCIMWRVFESNDGYEQIILNDGTYSGWYEIYNNNK